MPDYNAPLQDIDFLLHEVFEAEALWQTLEPLKDLVDAQTSRSILAEAAKIAEQVLAPLNQSADESGAQWVDGQVVAPDGFKEAYETFCSGGWNGFGGNQTYGGMGMPKMLTAQIEEMVQGACMAFGLAPMLTAGACQAINSHGSDALKDTYLPKMYEGTWSGAMGLTEPHAGTDLGIIRTKASQNEDGSYTVTGTKIFITWGDHDMAENIVHLVLAKLPDAPAGPKGISLFLVPKLLVDSDGSPGAANGVSCGSIEKKMGLHGSATCVMNFDGSKGWLIGEPHDGLACMFTMMNYERLAVGLQALGSADASYQNAVAYARERLQGRGPNGAVRPDLAADPIIVHPDVKRMLMDMRVVTEGSRAFSTYVAKWLDISKFSSSDTERNKAEALVALLTPVAKAFISDKAFDACVTGQQVFGGHGYVREWGQEQLIRDVRISQIYEGANGIQAMDLLGRKVLSNEGMHLDQFLADVEQFVDKHQGAEGMDDFLIPLEQAMQTLREATEVAILQAKTDPYAPAATANDFLHLFGHFAFAYMWAMMAATAMGQRDPSRSELYKSKILTARYYYSRHLPEIEVHLKKIKQGSEPVMGLDEQWF